MELKDVFDGYITVWTVLGAVVTGRLFNAVYRKFTVAAAVLMFVGGVAAVAALCAERRRRKQLEAERERLRQSEQSYEMLARLSDGVFFEGDYRLDTIVFNRFFKEMFGREPFCTTISGCKAKNPYVYDFDAAAYEQMADNFINGVPHAVSEFRMADDGGRMCWYRAEYMTVFDSSENPQRLIGKISNVDKQLRELNGFKRRAEYDSLSKLFNRESVEKRVNEYMKIKGEREQYIFLIADIDDFKCINDTYGHSAGDEVIADFSEHMRRTFRTSDILGRLGGDEFAALLTGVADSEAARMRIKELCRAASKKKDMDVRCSIGAVFASERSDFNTLYRAADAAMYRAKRQGKGRITLTKLCEAVKFE